MIVMTVGSPGGIGGLSAPTEIAEALTPVPRQMCAPAW